MLYLIATPIGNLEDITLRALRILKEVDYILCEDTRKAKVLLDRYKIKNTLKSYHKFSESKKLTAILDDLKSHQNIALISDGGSPLVSDPGLLLVKKCIENNISYSSIPGASSVVNGLVLSGLSDERFQFMGFFSKKTSERLKMLHQMAMYPGASLAFITPHNVEKILKDIQEYYPEKEIVILREMTKKFEEIIRGSANTLLKQFSKKPFKGEMVLALLGYEKPPQDLSVKETILLLQNVWMLSEKEAIEISAKIKNISKKEIYQKIKIKK